MIIIGWFMSLKKLEEELLLRGFTLATRKTYLWHVNNFLQSGLDKKRYLFSIIHKSPSSVRLASAAISFYEKVVLEQTPLFVPLPKKKQTIPHVLSKEQILQIIDSTHNEKHKIVVELLYSSGLRLQELVNLKFEDIDFTEKTIHVRQGKGRKDRLTIVSQRVLDRLDKQGIGYVLKGRNGKYTKRSVQEVLNKLSKKVSIQQKVTPHVLRHSFATHLLEDGVDIRYIQSLLGHTHLETTQMYTKVAKNKLKNIKSPLD